MQQNDKNNKYMELKRDRKKLATVIPLKMPFTLFVDPTNWCNFKCAFCPRNLDDFQKHAGPFKHMELALFEKIMQDVKAFDGGKLKVLRLFYLGEPLLCPDFLVMLRLSIRYDVSERIEISSNASLLSVKIANEILNLAEEYTGMVYLRFSIYSVISEKNKDITKSPIMAKQIRENIAVFKSLRDARNICNVRTYAKMLDTSDGENELFINSYKEIVDEVEIEQPMNWSGYENRSLVEGYLKNDIEMPKVCAYPFHTLAIQSDGDVVCCCVDWSRKTCVGNVGKQSLSAIWQGEKLKKFRLQHLTGKRKLNAACKNCEKLPCGKTYELDNLDNVSPEILT